MKTVEWVFSVVGWGVFSLGLALLLMGAFLAGEYNQEMINSANLIDIGVLTERPKSPMGFVSFLLSLALVFGAIGAFIVMIKSIVIEFVWFCLDHTFEIFRIFKKKICSWGHTVGGKIYHHT